MFKRGFSINQCPVNNLYEATTFIAWTIVAAYLVIGISQRLRFLGAFASHVLFFMGVFALMPALDPPHASQPDFSNGLVSLHAALILLAIGAFGLSAVAALMFLTRGTRFEIPQTARDFFPAAADPTARTRDERPAARRNYFAHDWTGIQPVVAETKIRRLFQKRSIARLFDFHLAVLSCAVGCALEIRARRTPLCMERSRQLRFHPAHVLGISSAFTDSSIHMNVVVIGLSHHTSPVELRERFAFADAKIPVALTNLARIRHRR